MNEIEPHDLYSSTDEMTTRVKVNTWKKTVGITLPQTLIEKARIHRLNISRITEQALSSILDYLETQNIKQSSDSLTEGSLRRETSGRVDQFGMIATLASWRPRVQIPPRPLGFL
jgi:post-segregation antitoxin (ccd killing protein)